MSVCANLLKIEWLLSTNFKCANIHFVYSDCISWLITIKNDIFSPLKKLRLAMQTINLNTIDTHRLKCHWNNSVDHDTFLLEMKWNESQTSCCQFHLVHMCTKVFACSRVLLFFFLLNFVLNFNSVKWNFFYNNNNQENIKHNLTRK